MKYFKDIHKKAIDLPPFRILVEKDRYLNTQTHYNGYETIRSLLKASGVDCTQYSSTFIGETNFIPEQIMNDEAIDINWLQMFKKSMPTEMFRQLMQEKVDVEEKLKAIDPNIKFLGFSIAQVEVACDVPSPKGLELISLSQIQRAFQVNSLKLGKMNYHKERKGESSVIVIEYLDELESSFRADEYNIPVLKGYLGSGKSIKCYIKQRNEAGNLNRFECGYATSEILRNELKHEGISGSFHIESEWLILVKHLYWKWFKFLKDNFQFPYKVDEVFEKVLFEEIAQQHPYRADLVAGALVHKGKISINAEFVMPTVLRRMQKNGILYKPDGSKAGRGFFAVSPDFKRKLAKSLGGGLKSD